MSKLHIQLLTCFLFAVSACHQEQASQNIQQQKIWTEKEVDSIYERFEDIAYNMESLYISNPDSFVNSLSTVPKTTYQKEFFTYGLIFIGYALMEHGKIYESIRYYEKAYNYVITESIIIDDINNTIIKPLSNLFTKINDTEKAINILQNTIQQCRNKEEIAALANNLSNAYLYNNQLEKAEQTILQNLHNTNNKKLKALLNNSLSSIYLEKKDSIRSKKYNQLAIKAFETGFLSNDTLLWYISALGRFTELNNDLSTSRKALLIANQKFPNTQNRLKAKIISIEAEVLKNMNKEEVIHKYDEIIHLLKTENTANTLDYTFTNALLGKADFYRKMCQIDSALFYYELGIENDFRTQQLITSPIDQLRNNRRNKTIVENLLHFVASDSSLRNNQQVLKQLLWCVELSKARLLINEINRSDQWINANSHTKSGIQKIQALYKQMDESLDNSTKENIKNKIHQLLIDFQLTEKYFESIRYVPNKDDFYKSLQKNNTDYYAYNINLNNSVTTIHKSDNRIDLHVSNDTSFVNKIKNFKKDYFSNSPKAYNNNPQLYIERSRKIVNTLLPNLKQEDVFISLDAVLYGLPFDALFQDDFLIHNHNFAYLNSFLLFNILKVENQQNYPISILYRSTYDKPLPSLNFVKEEVDNLYKSYKSEKIDSSKQKNEIFRQQFMQSNIIHIAAHTLLDSTEAPMIYLKNPISTNQIRYFEIRSPLVFLAACNTGKGESLPSEGTESLQRVFLSKNVPSVVSTYWFANDETMLKITQDFYQQLYQTNNPILALAKAKRHYLASANQQFENPWYWANINYTGIGNKIGLKKESSNLFYYIVAVVLIISCYLIRRLRLNGYFK